MNRCPNHRYAKVIERARRAIPAPIRHRLDHVRFLWGVDPVFVGLHNIATAKDGRSYKQTAHCCYPSHIRRPAAERVTTIVLPTLDCLTRAVVVHELGHALHEIVGFGVRPEPTTEYAKVDRYEAFAEAFTTWRFLSYGDDDALFNDGPTIALFEELAA